MVAVIDSGVAYTSEPGYAQATDLAGTTFVPGYDFIWDDDKPLDFDGHGTHVTGTIAQSTNNSLGVAGIAFNVAVIPVKVIGGDGRRDPRRAERRRCRHGVPGDSLRGGPRREGHQPESRHPRDQHRRSGRRCSLPWTAARWSSSPPATPPTRAARPSYPAAYATEIEGVIAVGATDYARNRAPYSNVNDYVEIAAPGGDTTQDLNGDGYVDGVLQQILDFLHFLETGEFNQFEYFFFDGTSMAAPHVAGLARC